MLPEMFTTTRDLPASAGTGIGAGEYLELVARSQGAQIGQPVVAINRCRRRLQGLVNVCQAAQPLKLTVRAEPSKQGIVAA